ncbi:MAG TPA: hypothetical protein VN802_03945 [Stellaceae bacterium]|nr:hypothetical protein [Stellaceae bacterium]
MKTMILAGAMAALCQIGAAQAAGPYDGPWHGALSGACSGALAIEVAGTAVSGTTYYKSQTIPFATFSGTIDAAGAFTGATSAGSKIAGKFDQGAFAATANLAGCPGETRYAATRGVYGDGTCMFTPVGGSSSNYGGPHKMTNGETYKMPIPARVAGATIPTYHCQDGVLTRVQ